MNGLLASAGRTVAYMGWVQVVVDALSAVLAAWVGVRIAGHHTRAEWLHHIEWSADVVVVMISWIAGLALLSLYAPRRWRQPLVVWGMAAMGTFVSTVIAFGALELVSTVPDDLRLGFILGCEVFAVLSAVTRAIGYRTIPGKALTRRFVLVGLGSGAEELVAALKSRHDPLARYVGYVPVDETDPGDIGGVRIAPEELLDAVDARGITDLVVCSQPSVPEPVARALAECTVREVTTLSLEEAYEEVTEKAPIFAVGDDQWLAGVRWVETNLYAKGIKRAADVVVGSVFLALSAPVILLGAMAVRLSSSGCVFYRQDRVGLRGRKIIVVKLRTMIDSPSAPEDPAAPDGEEAGNDVPDEEAESWAEFDEARVTPVGRVLRRFRIDELPQLWLVVRGHMSLIGPRPEQPHLVERYTTEIPLYSQRHLVQPGLTGWAQVNQSHEESRRDVRSKAQYDLYYISNLSFRLDVLVLIRTLPVLLFGFRRPQR